MITYIAMSSVGGKGRTPERALQLFDQMQQKKADVVARAAYCCVQPDVTTYCPVIRPCEGRDASEGLQLFEDMQQQVLQTS